MKISSTRLRGYAALGLAGLLFAGCSSSASNSGATTTQGTNKPTLVRGAVNPQAESGTPTPGGTLTLLDYNANDNLDPATTTNGGNTDSVRLAIFDSLMRYDDQTKTWQPELAKSLTPADGGKTWTLALRDGVKFTDGTPLDAAAVVSSMQRYAAKSTGFKKGLMSMVTGFAAPTPTTVVFTLAVPWMEFPYLLATDPGCITSPTAVASEGAEFAKQPVGAGPFKLASFTPGQNVKLVRNDDYWAGKPNLDGVNFQAVSSASLAFDQMTTGAANMIHVQGADQALKGSASKMPGWTFLSDSGVGLQVNTSRSPVSDPQVRQALAYAINYQTLNQRVVGGASVYGSSLFAADSGLSSSESGVSYDLEKAKALVEDAKKRLNWDGSLTYVALPDTSSYVQTVRAMLDAAGFKVNLVQTTDSNGLVQTVFVKKDFDVADSSLNLWASAPWSSLSAGVGITGYFGYKNATLDSELTALRSAPDAAGQKQALAAIQKTWNTEQPFVVTGVRAFTFFWAASVHGVVPNAAGAVLLGKAYISK